MNKLFLVLILIFISVKTIYATEFFAEKTGKDCVYCHKEVSGGGELTDEGKKFLIEIKGISLFKRLIRFITYFFHLFFAIAWFGTILYVHIILKPRYASGGLPKGELLLGWTSIIAMAITGTILTVFKIENVTELINSRYGIILSLKILFYLLMVFSALFVTLYLGPRMRKKINEEKKSGLNYYDGKDGKPAYIAVKSKIYDVTESKLWKDGVHMGRHSAGEDLTDALRFAPHKEDVLERFKTVEINLNNVKEKSEILRVFYFLAYTNLIIVFIIIFLVTLWKW